MAMMAKAISTIKATGLNAGDVINGVVGVSDYKEARRQGDSKGKAVVKAAASFAWGEILYGGMTAVLGTPLTMGAMMLPAAASLISAASEHGSKARAQAWSKKGQLGSGYFNMSEAGYTMRQRSLNAIQSNRLNTQSVLGNEARTYFRSST